MNWAWLYLAALYALAVFLARRGGVDLPKRAALFFYAVVLLFFFRPLTQDYTNIQNDVLKTIPPWTYDTGDKHVINPEMNDIPLQHVPWAHQAREAWKSLTPPIWNHLSGSGYPLLANGQSSAMSPIRLAALPLPLEAATGAEAAIKVLIAMTFTFLFCRGRGYAVLASVIGAVMFGLCGFIHVWLHFPHVSAACFLPAILYLVDRLAEKPTLARVVAAAVVWASILYGGHPETASHIFVLAFLYVVWLVFVEKRATWRFFLTLGGSMTIAALLAAPFFLTFLEALPKSQRYDALKVAPLEADWLPYTDWNSTVVLFQPHFFGRVPFEEAWGPSVAEPVGGFGGLLGIAGFFALAIHVVWRRRWRSPELFFVVATLLVFGVFQSWPLLGDILHAVLPVVAHARFRLLFVMLLAINAAAAVDLVIRGERKPLLAGLAIVAAMLIALLAFTTYPSADKRTVALLAAIPSALVLATGALYASLRRTVLLLALVVVVIYEMASVTRSWNPSLPNALMYPRTPLITRLIELKETVREPFRITAAGAPLFPNTSVMYGIEDVRAHDPMANARYLGFLALTAKYDPWSYHAMFPDPNASVFDFLNVRYLLTDPGAVAWPAADHWRVVYEGHDGRIFENLRPLPRFFAVRNVIAETNVDRFAQRLKEHRDWGTTAILESALPTGWPSQSTGAETRIVEAKPSSYRLAVRATQPTVIVGSIPWWPGWKVTRNGERVDLVRVNGVFLGFAVPAGESEVRVWYSPWTWWVGVWLMLLTMAVLAAVLLRQRFARS